MKTKKSASIVLPKKDKDGNYYVSYSQLKSWTEKKGFDTGKLGKHEYMRKYFLGETFVDNKGYGTFGTEVEAYITEGKEFDKFTNDERVVMDKIKPLGVFQYEFKLQFPGFYVKGFIDDMTPDFNKIRDYKTASRASGKKYEEDDYWQLDVYALAIKQITGKVPKELEVLCIERTGNGFKGGRAVLEVGKEHWIIPRKTNAKRLKELEEFIVNTTKEISKYYKVFLKLNKF